MRLATTLLTGLGVGRCPIAPGTAASLGPLAVALMLLWLLESPAWVNGSMITLASLGSIVCIAFGSDEERRVAGKDPSHVVADEIAGQSIALLFIPWHDVVTWSDAGMAAVAFIAFRVLDIAKPWPISRVQRLPGGWGILADDLLAGVGALLITQLIGRMT